MSELAHLDEGDLYWPNGEKVNVASIDAWSEHGRVQVMPAAEDSQVRGPDWVIRELDAVSRLAGQMVVVVKNAGALKRARAAVLRRAKADAQKRHSAVKGTEKTALVNIDVEDEQAAFDDAFIAEEYARRIADLVAERKSTIQTMSHQVEILFRDAGRGL